MADQTSQEFESYVPVYDAIPDKWEDAQVFLVEVFKKISNAINIRQIGWLLDEELLSGEQFIPSVGSNSGGGESQQFRSVFRKVVDFGSLTVGANTKAHGITVDANFTLMQLYAAATDSVGFVSIPIPNGADTIDMDATNININVAAAYNRCFAVVSYIQEI